MGYSSRPENVMLCLQALESVLGSTGAVEAGREALSQQVVKQGV
jgi:hypothetical protein